MISPFVLGFYGSEYRAAWNQIVIGLLVAVDALWALAATGRRIPT